MVAKHIKIGFKRFGGWVKNKNPYILYERGKVIFDHGMAYHITRGKEATGFGGDGVLCGRSFGEWVYK